MGWQLSAKSIVFGWAIMIHVQATNMWISILRFPVSSEEQLLQDANLYSDSGKINLPGQCLSLRLSVRLGYAARTCLILDIICVLY